VFNEPDVPSAKVVWARMMTAEQDRELTSYLRDRDVYVVDADAMPPVLRRVESP